MIQDQLNNLTDREFVHYAAYQATTELEKAMAERLQEFYDRLQEVE